MSRHATAPETIRPRFWERFRLDELTMAEWEALCDGCGRCCLHKLEDADSGEITWTRVACRLFDDHSCRCGQYAIRKSLVPECVQLTPTNIPEIAYWMPASCAYRRLHEGRGLPSWHPLLTGNPESVHRAGVSVRGRTVPEWEVEAEEYEQFVIEDSE